ncbi:MAG: outer membrane beta-barrel protein [Sphingobacteriales bacterium]|nr:outer membrane beta-barrel protein [Sphingobacteriales bacterium]
MSKKILLSIFASSCFIQILSAQISKGSVLLGGGIGLNTSTAEQGSYKGKSNGFFLNPAAGVAVKNNLIVGGDLQFNHSKNESLPNYSDKNQTYGAGFFVRKYKLISGKFYFFGQGRIGFSYSKNENVQTTNYTTNTKGWGTGFSIQPGISFAVNKRLHIEAGFNDIVTASYQHRKIEYTPLPNSERKENSFSIGTSLSNFSSSLFFGFRVLLNKNSTTQP